MNGRPAAGPGIWGDPPGRERAIQALRRAVALDVTFIDTADSYGPEVSERLIAGALDPYPEELVIATKGGLVRPGPGQWVPDGRPEHLRQACGGSLARLRLDWIELYRFHRPDPEVPIAELILDLCGQEMVVFIPRAPTEETGTIPALMAAARRRGVSERQVALAWLLGRSPQVRPIPGSGSPDHVEQNVAAASIELTAEEIRAITLAAVSR